MKTVRFTKRPDWRAWLSDNHATEREVWLLFYTKHTNEPTIAYDDAVEEAICFGWIDSIVKKIDDRTYARKCTPRINPYRWSDANRIRAKRMIETGRMTSAGMDVLKVDMEAPAAGPGGMRAGEAAVLPPHLAKFIQENEKARAGFAGLTNSQRGLYIRWIMSARREETRVRRTREAAGLLEQGKPLGLK